MEEPKCENCKAAMIYKWPSEFTADEKLEIFNVLITVEGILMDKKITEVIKKPPGENIRFCVFCFDFRKDGSPDCGHHGMGEDRVKKWLRTMRIVDCDTVDFVDGKLLKQITSFYGYLGGYWEEMLEEPYVDTEMRESCGKFGRTLINMELIGFFRLPFLPQQEIVKEFEFLDLLAFSMISDLGFVLVKSLHRTLKSLGWNVKTTADEPEILYFKTGDLNIKLAFRETPGAQESECNSYESLTDQVLSVFHFETFELQYGGNMDIINFFALKYTKKFEKLTILEKENDGFISEAELLFVLNELEVSELSIMAPVDPNVHYTGELRYDSLRVANSSWMTIASFSYMKVKRMQLDSDRQGQMTPWTIQNVNEFLKLWLTGEGSFSELVSLEVLLREHNNGTGKLDQLNLILEDIVTDDDDPAVEVLDGLELEHTEVQYYITREDGTTCRVGFDEQFRFLFDAWPANADEEQV